MSVRELLKTAHVSHPCFLKPYTGMHVMNREAQFTHTAWFITQGNYHIHLYTLHDKVS